MNIFDNRLWENIASFVKCKDDKRAFKVEIFELCPTEGTTPPGEFRALILLAEGPGSWAVAHTLETADIINPKMSLVKAAVRWIDELK